jgi:hypothetical protein
MFKIDKKKNAMVEEQNLREIFQFIDYFLTK